MCSALSSVQRESRGSYLRRGLFREEKDVQTRPGGLVCRTPQGGPEGSSLKLLGDISGGFWKKQDFN